MFTFTVIFLKQKLFFFKKKNQLYNLLEKKREVFPPNKFLLTHKNENSYMSMVSICLFQFFKQKNVHLLELNTEISTHQNYILNYLDILRGKSPQHW